MMRRAIYETGRSCVGIASEASSNQDGATSLTGRFENYEIILDPQGNPIELGRGAMGVTYKALDIHLRVPVALKVINDKYVSDQDARLRFVREARAAARVRHPNVASVFHLGTSGEELLLRDGVRRRRDVATNYRTFRATRG
jgi:hypothetical protein